MLYIKFIRSKNPNDCDLNICKACCLLGTSGLNVNSILQVLCDILFTGGLPGSEKGQQPPIYFANDDFEYQVGHGYVKFCRLMI